jgi:hypothetical protein
MVTALIKRLTKGGNTKIGFPIYMRNNGDFLSSDTIILIHSKRDIEDRLPVFPSR